MPQQQEFTPIEAGNQPGAPEVHYMFYGGVRVFKMNRKGADNLNVFTGDMGSFRFWKSKIIDKFCESTGRWRELLKKTQESDGPIAKKCLQDTHVGWGENA